MFLIYLDNVNVSRRSFDGVSVILALICGLLTISCLLSQLRHTHTCDI